MTAWGAGELAEPQSKDVPAALSVVSAAVAVGLIVRDSARAREYVVWPVESVPRTIPVTNSLVTKPARLTADDTSPPDDEDDIDDAASVESVGRCLRVALRLTGDENTHMSSTRQTGRRATVRRAWGACCQGAWTTGRVSHERHRTTVHCMRAYLGGQQNGK